MIGFKRNIYRRKILFAFVLGLLLPSIFLIKTVIQKVVAQGANEVDVYFQGPTDPTSTGSSYDLMVNSGTNKVAFASVVFTFDPTKIQLGSEVTPDTSSLNTNLSHTSMSGANSTGSITLVSIFFPGSGQTSADAPAGIFRLASLNFHSIVADPNVSASLVFNTSGSQFASPDYPGQAMAIIATGFDLSLNPVSVTPTATPEATPTPTPSSSQAELSLTLESTPAMIGNEILVDLNVSTNSPISGVDASINFDPAVLQVDSITPNSIMGGFSVSSIVAGNLKFSQTALVDTPFSGSGKIATIHITPILTGLTNMNFVFTDGATNESNVIEHSTGQDILILPTNLTIDVVALPRMVIYLKTASEDQVLGFSTGGTISINDGNWSYNFTADASGASETFDLPQVLYGQNISFFVKVPGYLVRKVNKVLANGTNILDAGALVAGDLNDDGTVNNVDLSLMYNLWFGTGVADYNKNGIIQNDDYWLLVNNFFKEDEK